MLFTGLNSDSLTQLRYINTNLEEKIESLERDLKSCKDQKATLQKGLKTLKNTLGDSKKDYEEFKSKIDKSNKKISILQGEIKSKNKEIDSLKQSLKDSKKGESKEIEDLNKKITSLKNEISFLKDKKVKQEPISTTNSSFARLVRGERSYSVVKYKPNIIKDNITGLLWQKSGSKEEMTYKDADKYCKNLELDGLKRWRLPTINELYYLADRTKYKPALDSRYFKSKNSWYWSITEYTVKANGEYKDHAWVVDFFNGGDLFTPESCSRFVRCVRQ
jgi:seryl-tRNA synthetase